MFADYFISNNFTICLNELTACSPCAGTEALVASRQFFCGDEIYFIFDIEHSSFQSTLPDWVRNKVQKQYHSDEVIYFKFCRTLEPENHHIYDA